MENQVTNNNDEIEIDLGEVFHLVISKLGVIILSGILLGVLSIIGTMLFITPKYESTTKIMVLNKQDNNTLTSADMQTSTQLTKDYAELIQSRTVLDAPCKFRMASLDGFFLEALDHHGAHGLDEHGGIGEPPGDHVKNTLHIRFA